MGKRVICWSLAAVLFASAAVAAPYRAPRTSAGAPDLGGMWSNSSLTDVERPDEIKSLVATEKEVAAFEKDHRGKTPKDPEDTVGGNDSEWWELDVGLARIRGQARSSWIVAPANGKLPRSPQAKAARKLRHEAYLKNFDNPESRPTDERCLSTDSAGPPMFNGGYNDNYQFVQTADHLAIYAEYMHNVRIVRIAANGARLSHPAPQLRRPMGDSIGHWDGATLVIETTNFTAAEADPYKIAPGSDMRVVERLTRTGPHEISYVFRVEQPAVFDQSWMGEMVFHPANGPMYEFACHEGNYAMTHMLAGARHEQAVATTGAPAASKPGGQ